MGLWDRTEQDTGTQIYRRGECRTPGIVSSIPWDCGTGLNRILGWVCIYGGGNVEPLGWSVYPMGLWDRTELDTGVGMHIWRGECRTPGMVCLSHGTVGQD